MAESISFFNFIHERSVPYRQTDFFDELVARFASNPGDLYPPKLFSKETIEELTEELVYLVSYFPISQFKNGHVRKDELVHLLQQSHSSLKNISVVHKFHFREIWESYYFKVQL